MDPILLRPTALAEWQALIDEAQHKTLINLEEEIESYLVFLLMRFVDRPEIAHSVLGLEFLNSTQSIGSHYQSEMRDVADKCLLFSGLFPGRAQKRRVPLSYFVKLGQSAYSSLSAHQSSEMAELYQNLSHTFTAMMDVLQATRPLAHQETLDLFDAYEQLQQGKNKQAAHKALCRATTAEFPLMPKIKNKIKPTS